MDHYGIHKAIFGVLEIAPLNRHWLRTLYELFDHLNFQQVAHPKTIDNALARWAQLDDEGSNDKLSEGHFTSLSLKDEFRCLVASLYGHTYSNNKPIIHGSPADPDVARRCAYYGNAKLSEKEMQAGYARDKEVFVFAAMNNTSVVLDNTRRKTFEEEIIWGGDLIRRYLRNFDLAKKRWPRLESSLSREEVTPSNDDARIEGLQTAVKDIERQLTVIGQKLQNSQQLMIGAAIGLAIVLYFRH